jgi:hypothetical protein
MGKRKQERREERRDARQEAKERAARQAARNTGTAVTQWANNNRGNQQVSGMANDLFYNAASADLQTRSDVNYAKQMMPLSLEYQRGSQSIATEADLRRMAAEGAITRDLVAQQGAINTGITKLETDAVRYGYDQQLSGTRYTADRSLDATRYSSDRDLEGTKYGADRMVDSTRLQTDAQRYGADRELEGSKYGADRMVDATRLQTDATRYVSDNDLTGLREGYQSQERQIGLRGNEDRKTLIQGTDETLRLRADARGAITKAGGRFFG